MRSLLELLKKIMQMIKALSLTQAINDWLTSTLRDLLLVHDLDPGRRGVHAVPETPRRLRWPGKNALRGDRHLLGAHLAPGHPGTGAKVDLRSSRGSGDRAVADRLPPRGDGRQLHGGDAESISADEGLRP